MAKSNYASFSFEDRFFMLFLIRLACLVTVRITVIEMFSLFIGKARWFSIVLRRKINQWNFEEKQGSQLLISMSMISFQKSESMKKMYPSK